jgi:hypothetical protein
MATENKEAISIINVPKYLLNIYSKRAEEYMLPTDLFNTCKQIYDIDTVASVNGLKIDENNQKIVYTTALALLALSSNDNNMLTITKHLLTILLDFIMEIDDPEKIEKCLHPKKLSKFILISYALSRKKTESVKKYVNKILTAKDEDINEDEDDEFEYDAPISIEFRSIIKTMIEAGWDELVNHYIKYFLDQDFYKTMLDSCLKFSDNKNRLMKHVITRKFMNVKKQCIKMPDKCVRRDIINQDFYMDSDTPAIFEELYKLYDDAKDEVSLYIDIDQIMRKVSNSMAFMECIRLRNEIKRLNDTKCKSEKNANDLKN